MFFLYRYHRFFAVKMDAFRSMSIEERKSPINGTYRNQDFAFPERKSLFNGTYHNQDFAFPGSLMYYVAKNPLSPKVYRKLIKSCKFFFVENPILVLYNLYYAKNGWVTWSNGSRAKVDLKNGSEKYWVAEYFGACSTRASIAASIVPRISRCNIQRLSLASQIISYNDLMVLAKDVEDLTMNKVFVK
uniref:Uncharacterized protein n=1 Tax=Panagrolaimus sp. PS1159 TaxID=55785 RepID=A0AC35GHJ5_9BILA